MYIMINLAWDSGSRKKIKSAKMNSSVYFIELALTVNDRFISQTELLNCVKTDCESFCD